MASIKMWTLVGLSLLCVVLTVQADNGSTTSVAPSPAPGGDSGEDSHEHDGRRRHHGDDDLGYDKDDDDDDDHDCDDHDDEDKGRMGDDMHKEKHHDDSKEGGEDYKEHGKRKRCHHKKIVKILIIVGSSIAVIGTGVGVVFCCMRHKRQMMRSVSESKTNLHVPGARENVYVVREDPSAPEKKPSALDFPVVSNSPLPGKE